MTVIENGSVLVAVHEYGEFAFLRTLCRDIEAQLGLHPVFVFVSGYGLLSDHTRLLELDNWSWVQLGTSKSSFRSQLDTRSEGGYIRVTDQPSAAAPGGVRLACLMGAAYALHLAARFRRAPEGAGGPAASGIFSQRRLKAALEHARQIFQKTQPKLVLSGQDYVLSVTAILAKVAASEGIKTAIVPYCMPPTTKEIIESFSYLGRGRIGGTKKAIAQALVPSWINVSRGHAYLREDLLPAIASDLLDLTPPQPWLPNSGRGVIFAPSQQCIDYYLAAGIPRDQLRLTGAPWNDHFVQAAPTIAARKAKLLSRVRAFHAALRKSPANPYVALKNNPNIVIISWPPNQWPRKSVGCASYEDLCAQFASAATQIQTAGVANVVVSLHPTLTNSELARNLASSGIYVLQSSLLNQIDCADVFVSTVSSTSFWALQCGIPTINFDGYLYGYTEFDSAGATTIRTPLEALETCEELFENAERMAVARKRIQEKIGYWTLADGRSMERIMRELAALLPGGQARAPAAVASAGT